MQGYARPDGAEKSMVYKPGSDKWEPRPKVLKEESTTVKTKSSKRGRSEEKSKAKKAREQDASKAVKDESKEAVDVKAVKDETSPERDWLQEENRLAKDIVGWKKRRPPPRETSPPRSDPEKDETDSLEEDELKDEDDPDMTPETTLLIKASPMVSR